MPAADTYTGIASLIRTIQDIIEAYGTIENLRGLPAAFHAVNKCLPLTVDTLRRMRRPAKLVTSSNDTQALETSLLNCEDKAESLLEIFQKIFAKSKNEYDSSVYRNIAVSVGKHRVETLMDGILDDLEILLAHPTFDAVKTEQAEPLESARKELAKTDPSLSDADLEEQSGSANQYGDGNRQNNNFGTGIQKIVDGNYFEARGNQNFGTIPSMGG